MKQTQPEYRIEIWNNAHTRPTNWTGKEIPTEWETVQATEWKVMIFNNSTRKNKVFKFNNKQDRDFLAESFRRRKDEDCK